MQNTPVNYIEFKSHDLNATKEFYSKAFGWEFTDYGPTYTAFSESGVEGGFELSDQEILNGVLIVLHHDNLEEIQEKIISLGGSITKEVFSFPGGRRFEFLDPSLNNLAVWCKE